MVQCQALGAGVGLQYTGISARAILTRTYLGAGLKKCTVSILFCFLPTQSENSNFHRKPLVSD